jgi:hypothetical protein
MGLCVCFEFKGSIRIFLGRREGVSTKTEDGKTWEKVWRNFTNLQLEEAGKKK